MNRSLRLPRTLRPLSKRQNSQHLTTVCSRVYTKLGQIWNSACSAQEPPRFLLRIAELTVLILLTKDNYTMLGIIATIVTS